jgi:choline dehydrogenase
MQQYLKRVYEWLPAAPTDPTILVRDLMLTQHLFGGAAVMGLGPPPLSGATGLLEILEDPNSSDPGRDSREGFFQIPLIAKNGARFAVRERITQTVANGYPLTVRTNCFVTKVMFNQSGDVPVATGVHFLDGSHLYRASPLSGGAGTPGIATARKEVILAGGTYNTVQLLKLSGVGPRDELEGLGIKTVVNLPGVGINMQDRYEIPLTVVHPNDFPILNGCTFDAKDHDKCECPG